MNPAHLHLIATHLPVGGVLFGLVILAWGLIRHHEEIKRAAFGLFVLAALCALPAYFSGEPAEGLVKSMPGFAKDTVDQHAEMAQLGLAATLLVGASALAGLLLSRQSKPLPPWLTQVVLVLAAVAMFFLAWTANLGGRVHHPEIHTEVR